jgi:hypothetical protein
VKHRKHSTGFEIRNNAHVGSNVMLDQYGTSTPHVGVSGFKSLPRYRLPASDLYLDNVRSCTAAIPLLSPAGTCLDDTLNKPITISVHISNSLFPNHWAMHMIFILSYQYYLSLPVGSLIVSDKLLSIVGLFITALK